MILRIPAIPPDKGPDIHRDANGKIGLRRVCTPPSSELDRMDRAKPLQAPAGPDAFIGAEAIATRHIPLMNSKPVIISIPHRLGKDEARRRLHAGFAHASHHFASLLTIDRQDWNGDRLTFHARALGQAAAGTIDVAEDHVRVEVTLPWLLGILAEKLAPAIRKETVLLLEKK